MFGKGTGLGVVFGILVAFTAATFGAAGAEENTRTSEALDRRAAVLEADLQRQEAALARQVGDLSEVGIRLEEAQKREEAAASRVTDLQREIRNLSRDIKAYERAAVDSRSRFEDRLTAAYKGRQLKGIALMLQSLFGGSAQGDAALSQAAVRMLSEDRKSMQYYKKDRRLLGDMIRQLEGRRVEYDESREEHRVRVEELERREAELEDSTERSRAKKGWTEAGLDELEERMRELEARERAGLLDPPASSGGDRSVEEEARIAREEIVAERVEDLPLARYRQLYREAAEDYGFGSDWYVLMAVGKIESNHGESMGPSSSGAMGPMQFLPSTWEFAGVDGNGDGAANIMDPEDAIPAAAKYLADNGAPEDWYAALYAYNHAGWYVREVLEVAEGYRVLAGDDSVGPYRMAPGPATTSTSSENYAEELPTPRSQPASGEPALEESADEEKPAERPAPPEETTSPQYQY